MEFPVIYGTPVVVSDFHVKRNELPPKQASIQSIMAGLYLPETSREKIDECFRLQFEFKNSIFQSESEQFLERLRSSGLSIDSPYPQPKPSKKTYPISNRNASAEISVLTWPRQVRTNEDFSVTVVIRNVGQTVITEKSWRPFRLSYRWEGLKCEALRTKLLLDLEPGRQISMPVVVRAPAIPGSHKVTILPVVERYGWLPNFGCSASVDVHPSQTTLEVDWPINNTPRGYNEDHTMAKDLLDEWMSGVAHDRRLRILEIGGNFNPMIPHIKSDADFYNVDIDPFGLICHSIRDVAEERSTRNIVADGNALPFEDGYFDAIVMFSTFHHFPDPVGLLKSLKAKLTHQGFVALMCEPVGHVFVDTVETAFLNELKKGVYEQSFMLWEYRDLLRAAGFEVKAASVDYGSLKLKAERADMASA